MVPAFRLRVFIATVPPPTRLRAGSPPLVQAPGRLAPPLKYRNRARGSMRVRAGTGRVHLKIEYTPLQCRYRQRRRIPGSRTTASHNLSVSHSTCGPISFSSTQTGQQDADRKNRPFSSRGLNPSRVRPAGTPRSGGPDPPQTVLQKICRASPGFQSDCSGVSCPAPAGRNIGGGSSPRESRRSRLPCCTR